MEMGVMVVAVVLLLVGVWLLFSARGSGVGLLPEVRTQIQNLLQTVSALEGNFKEDFRISRQESKELSESGRRELANAIRDFRTELMESVRYASEQNKKALEDVGEKLEKTMDKFGERNEKSFTAFQETLHNGMNNLQEVQRDKFTVLADQQKDLVTKTENKLESIRATVEEKLEKTLNDRIGQSFEKVSTQLTDVHQGLGEMKALAASVGDLKKAMSNVKVRGNYGEAQLAALLEDILAAGQYQANVKTSPNRNTVVEFAIKLPGTNGQTGVWLPIDSKWPGDKYEALINAYENYDALAMESSKRELRSAMITMAKDISSKYIDVPHTTDFALMFLPFENVYAEIVRDWSLVEELRTQYKIIVAGPNTLAAMLNGYRMGFATLAIEKRSSEVYATLTAVQQEFEKLAGMIDKARKNIRTGLGQLDTVVVTRSNAMRRVLRRVGTMDQNAEVVVLPEFAELDDALFVSDDGVDARNDARDDARNDDLIEE
jgi:DNA recombination protein RmuC